METINRKSFIQNLTAIAGVAMLSPEVFGSEPAKKSRIQLGFVTYLWGKDWDLPTLIKNCSDTNILGVELRVEHAHKVTPDLSADQRKEVKKRFADSPVKLIGLGTNQQ